ncbi:MAG: helix-turn-helix transcriptional regulator [Roseivirga sp.]|nr:helix-turn-helix transcriptional regulator [Roseivirga sp.]
MRHFKQSHIGSQGVIVFGFGAIIIIAVLTFNVFHFSTYYGFVQVNYINSLYLIPFIALIFSFGIFLGKKNQQVDLDELVRKTPYRLSEREMQIVKRMISGDKNKDIAESLFVELSTVKTHINNIYKKVGVKNRTELKQAMTHNSL